MRTNEFQIYSIALPSYLSTRKFSHYYFPDICLNVTTGMVDYDVFSAYVPKVVAHHADGRGPHHRALPRDRNRQHVFVLYH